MNRYFGNSARIAFVLSLSLVVLIGLSATLSAAQSPEDQLSVSLPASPAAASLVCNGPAVDFESGIPTDWTVVDNITEGGIVWTTTADPACGISNLTNGSGEAACADSVIIGLPPYPYDTELVTSPFDLTGYSQAQLDTKAYYADFVSGLDHFEIDIWDGSGWSNLLSWDEDHQPEDVSLDLTSFAGMSGLQIRYHYFGFLWGYAQVDDVSLTCPTSDLQIVKDDGGLTVIPGDTLTYTLTFTNTGGLDATGVVLTDTVPANTAFNPGASTAGWSCVPDNSAGSTCTLAYGGLTGDSSDAVDFAVDVDAPFPASVSQIDNTAEIGDDGANGPDHNPGDNSDSVSTPINATPDLQILKDDGGLTVVPGETLTYTLTFTNAGDQGATGVVLTDTVPANTAFNPGASTAGWSCSPDNGAGSICTLAIGALTGGGDSGLADFAVDVDDPLPAGVTQIDNTAEIGDDGANGLDQNPGDNSDGISTPVNAAPDLQILKDDGGLTVAPGDTMTYTLTFTNAGDQGATGVVLTDTVPANTTFNPGASTASWSCVPDNSAGSICTLAYGALTGDSSGAVDFAVDVDDPFPAGVTQIDNTAEIGDDEVNGPDQNPGDNSDSVSTPVNAASDLQILKDDGDLTVAPGDTLTYTLTYTNAGYLAEGVVITDTVPANTTFDPGASTAGWSCAPDNSEGSTCTLVVGTLSVGGGGSADLVVTVDSPVPPLVSTIDNTVEIGDDGSHGPDANPGDNSDSISTPIEGAPDLQVSKFADGDMTLPGAELSYTIVYTNAGDQGLTGVVLTDTVPANTSFNPGASSPGWVCAPDNSAGSICTLAIGSLSGGAGGSVLFVVDVDDNIAGSVREITNTVEIGDDGAHGPDANPEDNLDSVTTQLNRLLLLPFIVKLGP